MTIDVSAMIGAFPFRALPHPDPEVLVRVLDREQLDAAWVGHLPSVFYRDPREGNRALYRDLAPFRSRLHPVPAVRPDWPRWRDEFARAVDAGAPAVRAYPVHWSLGTGSYPLQSLAQACAEHSVSLVLTVRFEDARQRHSMDVADLPAATIREVARTGSGARIVVVAAGRATIEEIHWGLTPSERELVWYDTSWIWGPPEDDFAHLLRTVGAARFVYGTGWPLRLAQVTRANLALLPPDLRSAPLADPSTWKNS